MLLKRAGPVSVDLEVFSVVYAVVCYTVRWTAILAYLSRRH